MVGTYDTATLLGVMQQLDEPDEFLLNTFFPRVFTFDTEEVDLDKVSPDGKTLAPLVLPDVPAEAKQPGGYQTTKIKPAYVKPKHAVKPDHVLARRQGESFGGELPPAARRDAIIADLLRIQRNQIIRRRVWMAASILTTGKITLVGDKYPKRVVDFQRDASLTKSLTGTARWGESGVKVLDTIEDWAGAVADKGNGALANQVVMDPKAWRLARTDESFLKLLDVRRQASGSMELGPLAVGSRGNKLRYLGSIGDFDFWQYSEDYTDDSGAKQKLIPDYGVILAGGDLQGVQAHGAILDPKAGYQALEFFPKNWVPDDPPVEQLMTQSAPLVAPGEPNGCLFATVWNP
jgi:hypothetical protein